MAIYFFMAFLIYTIDAGMGTLTNGNVCNHAAPVNFRRAYTDQRKSSTVPDYAFQMISCDLQNNTIINFQKTLPLDSSESTIEEWELFVAFTGYTTILINGKSYESLFPFDTNLVLYRFLIDFYPRTVQIISRGGPLDAKYTIPSIYKPAIYKSTITTTASLVGTILFSLVFLIMLFFIQKIKN